MGLSEVISFITTLHVWKSTNERETECRSLNQRYLQELSKSMDGDVKEVVLTRNENLGFGFSIIGGKGTCLPPIICDIIENSPADLCGQIDAGDELLEVNRDPVSGFTTKEVLNRLKASGEALRLKLRDDPAVKERAEKFLFCPPEDTQTLSHVITQDELLGVSELIVKRHTTPTPKLRRKFLFDENAIERCESHVIDRCESQSPEMPRKPEAGDGHVQSRLPVQRTRPVGGRASPAHPSPQFVRHSSQENGVTSPQRKSGRKYETFVMTGDMIIHTTSERNESDMGPNSRRKKSVDGDPKHKNEESTSAKKKKVEQGSRSKLPKLNTPGASPRLACKTDSSKPPPHAAVKASPTSVRKIAAPSSKSAPQVKSGIPSPKTSPKRKPVQHSPQSSPSLLPKFNARPAQNSPSLLPKSSAPPQQSPSLIPKSSLPKPSPKIGPKKAKVKCDDMEESADWGQESLTQPDMFATTIHKSTERHSQENVSGDGKDLAMEEGKINEGYRAEDGGAKRQVNNASMSEVLSGEENNVDLNNARISPVTRHSELNTNISGADYSSNELVTEDSVASNKTQSFIATNEIINAPNQAISDSDQQTIHTELLQNKEDILVDIPPPSPPPPPTKAEQDVCGISPFDDRPRPVYHACQAMPITLDIPPDDICSEDELLGRMDYTSFDMDDLPPPPEELLSANFEDFIHDGSQLSSIPGLMGLPNHANFEPYLERAPPQQESSDLSLGLTTALQPPSQADVTHSAINKSSPASRSQSNHTVNSETVLIEAHYAGTSLTAGAGFQTTDRTTPPVRAVETDLPPSAIEKHKSEFDDSFYSQDSDRSNEEPVKKCSSDKMSAPLVVKNNTTPPASHIPRPSAIPLPPVPKCINKSPNDSELVPDAAALSPGQLEEDAHELYFEQLLESPPYSHAMDNSFTLGMLSANTSMDTSFTIVDHKASGAPRTILNSQRHGAVSDIPKASPQNSGTKSHQGVNIAQNEGVKSPVKSSPPDETPASTDSADVASQSKKKRGMVASKSAEKITPKNRAAKSSQHAASPLCVRNSKSQENYLDDGGMTLIDIDFEDNMASSVDALHYDQSSNSLDHADSYNGHARPFTADRSQSLENSPERRYEKLSDKIHMPTFFSILEPHSISNKPLDSAKVTEIRNRSTSDSCYGYRSSTHAQLVEDGSGESSPEHQSTPIVSGQNVTVYPVPDEKESVWIVKESSDTVSSKTNEATENKRNSQEIVPQSPSKHKSPKDRKSPKHKTKGQSPKHKRKPNPADASLTPPNAQLVPESQGTHEQKNVKGSKSRSDQKIPQSDIFYQHSTVSNTCSEGNSSSFQKTPSGGNLNVNNNERRAPVSDKSPTEFQLQELNSSPKSPRKRLQVPPPASPKRPQQVVTMPPANGHTSRVQDNERLSPPSTNVHTPSNDIHLVSNGFDKQSVTTDKHLAGKSEQSDHVVPHSPGCTPPSPTEGSDKRDISGTQSPVAKNTVLSLQTSPQTVQNHVTSSPKSKVGQSSPAVSVSPQSQGISQNASLLSQKSISNSKPNSSSPVDSSPTRHQPTLKAIHSPTAPHQSPPQSKHPSPQSPTREVPGQVSQGPPSPEYDADSIYHQPLKDVDIPSAKRLAKRLFHLEGFKKSDISKHLSKKNDFAQQVGEEFLAYFDFSNMTLDEAIRSFLLRITLAGETQERERVLVHFSRRYMQCNPGSYNSEDACHTLLCALLLLNTDLHGQNVGRKMSVDDFIENLCDLNDGENFPRDVLRNLYQSIKNSPLEMEFDEESDTGAPDFDLLQTGVANLGGSRLPGPEQQRYVGHNPFLDIPDPNKGTEYKKGFVMRKCCVEPDGRKTPVGKRGWKMFYAVLKDMVLYLHKDEHAYKKNAIFDNMSNALRVHHALALKATDYKKKQHVFRVTTADWAEYLFQTGNSEECQKWIDAVNTVAATLSAPPLPSAVGSQKRFQKPLLPACFTRYNAREQLQHHEQRVSVLERELHEHRKYPPEKGSKARTINEYIEKEQYLQHEAKRFKTYCFLLQSKIASYSELEPSLVETAICEVSEPPSPSSEHKESPLGRTSPVETRRTPDKRVHRSMSDRYSYRAAVNNRHGYPLG